MPVTLTLAKAKLIADAASGIEYLGCFIKSVGVQLQVRPQESKIQAITQRIKDMFTAKGRDSFPQRIIAATQVMEAWIGSYRSLCGMSRMSKRVSNSMASDIEELLHQRGILSSGRRLDSKQRAFLGFQPVKKRKTTRPTRAHVRMPTSIPHKTR